MKLDELKELIANGEGETVEVKESTGQRRDACETLGAILLWYNLYHRRNLEACYVD